MAINGLKDSVDRAVAAMDLLCKENSRLRDFAHNIAGLDDRLLQNTDILKQWRDDARRLLK